MFKLLLLSLVLLQNNCSSSRPGSLNPNQQEEMEKAGANAEPEQTKVVGVTEQVPIAQGITGKVLWVSGNKMPSPDAPQSSGRRGIQRTLYIYELTNSRQVTTIDGVFHIDIQANLVTQVVTDASGNFTVSLKPGRYSLFTKEDKGLYANLFDGENNIFPVKVEEGQVTNVEFLINYNAHY
ncbi:carboxypeptidase regulatory-like domain-containing protein [Pontibacter silvestris]|uniref:Carboxypeptidase regulatory-like domain-containing protein n=1 Tax=Pontibacter silvestris TaxID=2305183 RepID=A0ABW4WW40_9BACT|nr:carboxypeptidase regulatory-like domain-containing protein [Pontibacter silvestris]MCC9136539.1 carboxypeptidase regulatory-like domain-containing protein [Pontibacter silvestris]